MLSAKICFENPLVQIYVILCTKTGIIDKKLSEYLFQNATREAIIVRWSWYSLGIRGWWAYVN